MTAAIVTASPISPTPACAKEHQHTAITHQLLPNVLQSNVHAVHCALHYSVDALYSVPLWGMYLLRACVRSVLLFCAVRSLTSFSSPMVWSGRGCC
jgi:hypothetical protein